MSDVLPQSKLEQRMLLIGCVGLFAIVLIAYATAYRNQYIWDDDHYVYRNLALRSSTGLKEIWLDRRATPQYYPMVHSSYWLEYRLWKLDPAGYHVVNALLHSLSAVLLWFILMKLQVPGAWFAAAVFAVHPVHVESVGWITERKNVLSGVFFFLSLLAFMRAVSWSRNVALRSPDLTWYACSLGLFVAALLSKTVTCSLPAVIVLLVWWQRERLTKQDVKVMLWLIPFFVVGLGLALNTVVMEKEQVGAQGAEWGFSMIERCLIAGRSLWFYMGKLIWPHPLIFFYERWNIDGSVWWQFLYPLGFGLLLIAAWWYRKRVGRGYLAGLLIFAGMLLPALGFFNVYPHRYSFVADHFQYLASVAFTTLVVAAVVGLCRRYLMRDSLKRMPYFVGAGVLLILAGLTLQRNRAYMNEVTLWTETIRQNPDCWAAYNNLGIIHMDAGQNEQALDCFLQARRANPNHANAQAHLGMVYERVGRNDDAAKAFSASLMIEPRNSNTHLLAGNFYARTRRFDLAMNHFREALMSNPGLFDAHLGAGHVFMEVKQYDKAEGCYTRAIGLHPRHWRAYEYRARSLAKLNRQGEALADIDQALGLVKGEADRESLQVRRRELAVE